MCTANQWTGFYIIETTVMKVLNKKNIFPKNHTLEQREVSLKNIDHSIDAQNFKRQNMP